MSAACRAILQKAILPLLAYSGLRNEELCGLKIGNVEIDSRLIHVRSGKGQEDRDASVAAPCAGSAEPLFATLQDANPYRPSDLRKLTHVVAKRAHIAQRVHPHLFRLSMATNMPIRGAHILAIKEQLGRAFVETTAYLHAAPMAMQAQHKFFAPSYMRSLLVRRRIWWVGWPHDSASRQQADYGKGEALRIGVAGGMLERLLARIAGKRDAGGVAQLYVVAGDIEVECGVEGQGLPAVARGLPGRQRIQVRHSGSRHQIQR